MITKTLSKSIMYLISLGFFCGVLANNVCAQTQTGFHKEERSDTIKRVVCGVSNCQGRGLIPSTKNNDLDKAVGVALQVGAIAGQFATDPVIKFASGMAPILTPGRSLTQTSNDHVSSEGVFGRGISQGIQASSDTDSDPLNSLNGYLENVDPQTLSFLLKEKNGRFEQSEGMAEILKNPSTIAGATALGGQAVIANKKIMKNLVKVGQTAGKVNSRLLSLNPAEGTALALLGYSIEKPHDVGIAAKRSSEKPFYVTIEIRVE